MNMRLGFFPYEAINYKAAQAWLDRRAERGWALKRVWLGCVALLQRAEAPRHFVDLDARGGFDGDVDADYLQLCADAGWELVQNLRGMLLFRSAPGKSPVPIQTDSGIEWERFWEKYRPRFRNILVTLLCLGLLAVALALPSRRNFTAMLALNSGLLYALYVVLMIAYIALEWVHSRWYLARCRRSGRVEDPGPAAAVLGSLCWLRVPILCLCLLFMVLEPFAGKTVDLDWYPMNEEYTATVEACRGWPVVMASDLGLPDSEDSRRLEGFRSPLMDFLEYRELTDGEGPDVPVYILTTERYDCLSESLAKWAVRRRREETRNGAFLWGELEWEPAPGLGFDECYICRDGSYLLFRQGGTVVLTGCSGVDLTTEQSLTAVRERVLK